MSHLCFGLLIFIYWFVSLFLCFHNSRIISRCSCTDSFDLSESFRIEFMIIIATIQITDTIEHLLFLFPAGTFESMIFPFKTFKIWWDVWWISWRASYVFLLMAEMDPRPTNGLGCVFETLFFLWDKNIPTSNWWVYQISEASKPYHQDLSLWLGSTKVQSPEAQRSQGIRWHKIAQFWVQLKPKSQLL